MYKLFHNFSNLFAPNDTGGGSTTLPEMSKEDVIKFLGDDDEEVNEDEKAIPLKDGKKEDSEDKKEEVSKEDEEETEDESEDEEDELSELEEELEEPDEEKLELTSPVSKREILKKYPTIFKDFPYLEKAYYREQQFTELFPTIQEAREANDKSNALDRYEKDLLDGNLENTLRIIHKESPNGFAKVADDYMATLAKVDKNAHNHVIGNIVKHVISHMAAESNKSENKQLMAAAVLLNQFVFGTSNYEEPKKLAVERPEVNEEEERIKKERQELVQERFNEANTSLNTKVQNSIRATIDANIDPKDSMGPYVKKAAITEAFESTLELIDKDSRFKNILDRLWENAFRNKFSKESTDKIRSAFMTKAKTILPATIKQARNNALKGIGKRVRDTDSSDDKEESTRESSSPKNERRSAPKRDNERNAGRSSDSKKVPAGMSTLDYLMAE